MTSRHAGLGAERLARLVDAGRDLVADLDLEVILARLLEAATDVTGARYAALGILDAQRRELERFVTRGIDEERRAAIGDPPRGRGILGLLIEDPRPLRLDRVGRHPVSYGFPPAHPQMETFLGVPILIRGEAWGNLYLTEKRGGPFTEADEQAVLVLAEWAAAAIDNARQYGRTEQRRDELERAVQGLEATMTIAKALGGETDVDRVLELIVKRGRALVDARALIILLHEGEELVAVAAAGEIGDQATAGRVLAAGSLPGEVVRLQRSERVDRLSHRLRASVAALGLDAEAALLVPLVFRGRSLGVLTALDRRTGGAFDDEDQRLLEAFAASAATAVATARSVEAQRLRKSLEAAEHERRRWARELHDDTLQALGGLRVLLSSVRRIDDAARIGVALEQAVGQIDEGIEGLRGLIRELRPPALDELGLEPALEELAARVGERAGIGVSVDVVWAPAVADGNDGRDPELEIGLYRVVQEALTNVVKHAGARTVQVEVVADRAEVRVAITDDGRGFDPAGAAAGGYGLIGMSERVAMLGGELTIRARTDGGTAVEALLPLGRATRSADLRTAGESA